MEHYFETAKKYGAPITGTVPRVRAVGWKEDWTVSLVTTRPGIRSVRVLGEKVSLMTVEGAGRQRPDDERTMRERRDACLEAMSNFPLRMTLSWDELRKATREQ